MTFGEALAEIKWGKKLTREHWVNAKCVFLKLTREHWVNAKCVFLVPGSTFTVSRAPLNAVLPEGTEVNYRPHIDMLAADGTVGTWAPSMHDVLAEDWKIVE